MSLQEKVYLFLKNGSLFLNIELLRQFSIKKFIFHWLKIKVYLPM